MKTLIVGFGNQGQKRKKYINKDFVGSVDPHNKKANFKNIRKVPLNFYDTALICTPDQFKYDVIRYCLNNKKHILVEKPLSLNKKKFDEFEKIAKKNKLILYTAYNHRFEPHFINMKKLIHSGKLGKIYSCRMFYGNGTAKLVFKNKWKDKSLGIISDLGSHLLDTYLFFFGKENLKLNSVSSSNFENRSPDHAIINLSKKKFNFQMEMSLCMWKNHFTCDVLAEKGSAHIESLCKWGPTKFSYRKRIFPSGKPKEKILLIKKKDPTWSLEYKYFKNLILKNKKTDLANDFWISKKIKKIQKKIKR